jgi:hypothetical protein
MEPINEQGAFFLSGSITLIFGISILDWFGVKASLQALSVICTTLVWLVLGWLWRPSAKESLAQAEKEFICEERARAFMPSAIRVALKKVRCAVGFKTHEAHSFAAFAFFGALLVLDIFLFECLSGTELFAVISAEMLLFSGGVYVFAPDAETALMRAQKRCLYECDKPERRRARQRVTKRQVVHKRTA